MIYPMNEKTADVFGARYTVYLKTLVDMGFDFGLDVYPIFDNNYRNALNKKLLQHYFYQEIGFETPALFRHYLNLAMNEIMPYYNKLYQTTLITLNPLLEFEHKETSDRLGKQQNVGNENSETNSEAETSSTLKDTQNSSGKNITSDTPQNLLASGSIEGNKWATQAALTDSNTIGENEANALNKGVTKNKIDTIRNVENTDNYIRTFSGYNTHPADTLLKIRSTIINIDMEIINHVEIKSCFMGVY